MQDPEKYDEIGCGSEDYFDSWYIKVIKKIFDLLNKRIYLLPKFICSLGYHRFGYYEKKCSWCGKKSEDCMLDGFIIDSDYDDKK